MDANFDGQDDQTLDALRDAAESELAAAEARVAELRHQIRLLTREQSRRFRDYIESRVESRINAIDRRTMGSMMVGSKVR